MAKFGSRLEDCLWVFLASWTCSLSRDTAPGSSQKQTPFRVSAALLNEAVSFRNPACSTRGPHFFTQSNSCTPLSESKSPRGPVVFPIYLKLCLPYFWSWVYHFGSLSLAIIRLYYVASLLAKLSNIGSFMWFIFIDPFLVGVTQGTSKLNVLQHPDWGFINPLTLHSLPTQAARRTFTHQNPHTLLGRDFSPLQCLWDFGKLRRGREVVVTGW